MRDWDVARWIVFFLPLVLAMAGLGAYLLFKKDIRPRNKLEKELADNPDITEWLVIFGWSRKVIYLPTVFMSLVCFVAGLAGLSEDTLGTLGTIWLFAFLCNFVVEEYRVGLKELFIIILSAVGAGLWMAFLGLLDSFIGFIGRLSVQMNGIGYLLIALVFLSAIVISWLRGLFNYAALTPNYVNIQSGLTESGDQIGREDYSTKVDTGDVLERLMGLGTITISYKDPRKSPDSYLVWNIGRKSRRLESIRSAIAIERSSRV